MSGPALVAVVDDDEGMRAATAQLLSEHGCSVCSFGGGEEFLDRAPLDRLRCVLLDVRMPRMNGLEVLEGLRQRHAAVPVILLTGHADVPLAVQAMRAGAHNLLQKPYRPDQLIAAVQDAVERSTAAGNTSSERSESLRLIAALAPRQRQIMAGLVKGHQNKTIASKLGLSVRTVEAHRRVVMRKLGARSLSDVLRRAVTAGLPIVDVDYDGRWAAAVEDGRTAGD